MIAILGLGTILTLSLDKSELVVSTFMTTRFLTHIVIWITGFFPYMVITQHVRIVDHIVDFLFLVPLSGRREGNGGDVQTTLPAWNRARNPSSLLHVGISRAEVVWDMNELWWKHDSQFWHCLGQSGPATCLCQVGNGVSKGLLVGITLLCHDIFSDGRLVIWNSWWQQLELGERWFLLFLRILAERLISHNFILIIRQ